MDLARLLLGALPGQMVDHKNGNGLDNRRENLRIADAATNAMNRHTTSARSGMRGVYRMKHRDLWSARIMRGGKNALLKYFKTKEEAVDEVRSFLRAEGVPVGSLSTPPL